MNQSEFIKKTVMSLDENTFSQLKSAVLDGYITFYMLETSDITKSLLSEKLCDYFEKLEIKTNKSFDKQLDAFIKNIDSVVSPRIAKTPKPKKKDPTPIIVPRSRKFYERANTIKESRSLTIEQLADFTRLILCLYSAIIANEYKEIENFDYSINTIDIDKIIDALKSEKDALLNKKSRFDTKELYGMDTGTFIITMIMICYIKNNEIQGDYYHG